MTATTQASSEVRELLKDSARWRLLSALFQRPASGWQAEIGVLAREVQDEDLKAAASQASTGREGGYLELLGPGGVVSAREVAYRPMGDPGHLLADLKGFYGAFRYFPRSEEPLDHISVEAGFVGFLRLKQAFAAARGETARLEVTADALGKFSVEHLAEFIESFSGKLAAVEPHYLSRSGRVLLARTHMLTDLVALEV